MCADVKAEFPDVDAAALPWPAGAEEWEPKADCLGFAV